jgi:hypothetical protein
MIQCEGENAIHRSGEVAGDKTKRNVREARRGTIEPQVAITSSIVKIVGVDLGTVGSLDLISLSLPSFDYISNVMIFGEVSTIAKVFARLPRGCGRT